MNYWSDLVWVDMWIVVGAKNSLMVFPSRIPRENDQLVHVITCKQLDALSPFNPFSKM